MNQKGLTITTLANGNKESQRKQRKPTENHDVSDFPIFRVLWNLARTSGAISSRGLILQITDASKVTTHISFKVIQEGVPGSSGIPIVFTGLPGSLWSLQGRLHSSL